MEEQLSTALPRDFKQLVESYGCGSFSDFLHLMSPRATGYFWNLREGIKGELEAYRVLRSAGDLSQPVFPEPGGLLPWMTTLNGDVVSWEASGLADSWPVVVNTSRTDWFERFDENATTFIFECLSGQLKPKAFPSNAFDELYFRPVQES